MIRKWVLIVAVILGLTGCAAKYVVYPEEQDKVKVTNNIAVTAIPPLRQEPLQYDASQFGWENEGIATSEEAKKKYPDYAWYARSHSIEGDSECYLPNATSSNMCYFEGIDNAKQMAYSHVLTEEKLKNFKDMFKGRKIIVAGISDWKRANYECKKLDKRSLWEQATFRKEVNNGQEYWSCKAKISIRVLIGVPTQDVSSQAHRR